MTINERKKKIVKKHGTAPTITYYYYLWNLIDYIGEQRIEKSFESIRGQGDEIIVGDYSSTDTTKHVARKYGFKVVNVEKTKDVLFAESKVRNKVILEAKGNFLCALNPHVECPKNLTEIIKNWLRANDITKKVLRLPFRFYSKDGRFLTNYGASYIIYRPYLLEARGYDERTHYAFGSASYGGNLLTDVYELSVDELYINMKHKYHDDKKFPILKKMFKIDNKRRRELMWEKIHLIISGFKEDFDKGAKEIYNSYW